MWDKQAQQAQRLCPTAAYHEVSWGHRRLPFVARATPVFGSSGRDSACVHGNDLVVKPGEAPLVLADELRLERAVSVARHLDGQGASVGERTGPGINCSSKSAGIRASAALLRR